MKTFLAYIIFVNGLAMILCIRDASRGRHTKTTEQTPGVNAFGAVWMATVTLIALQLFMDAP